MGESPAYFYLGKDSPDLFFNSPILPLALGKTLVFSLPVKPFSFSGKPHFWAVIFLLLLGSACSEKSQKLQFGIFPDQGESPKEAWERYDSLQQDLTLFNPGITRTPWWLGFSLSNPSDSVQQVLFVPNNPHINQIRIYEDSGELVKTELGDVFPFAQRPFRDGDLVIPLTLPPKTEKHFLLWMEKVGETFHIEPELYDFQSFQEQKAKEVLTMGLILGWMSIIFLFALFFSFELKSWSGAIYAAYVLSISLWLSTHWGLTFQYVWPESTHWAGLARPFFNLLTNILILLLAVIFFPPVKTGKKVAQVIYLCAGFQALMALVMILPFGIMESMNLKILFLQITLGVSILTSGLVLLYPYLQWRANVPLAGFYLLGIAFLALFGIILQLNQKIIPMGLPHYLLDFGSAFGLMGETGIITAAFARRASLFKKEKEKLSIAMLEQEKKAAVQLIEMQEEERKRIGRDLHDSIGGMLASLYLKTEIIQENHPDTSLRELQQMIEQSIQEARSLSHNLTPHHLEENGLENVLRVQTEMVRQKHPIDIHFYYKIESELSSSLQLILYRISHELLQNILKHAQADEALLSISEQNGKIELIAEDNGKGMEPNAGLAGIGLKNIQERVTYLKGTLDMESNSSGTTLIIQIPLDA